jgi:hypothetical protein
MNDPGSAGRAASLCFVFAALASLCGCVNYLTPGPAAPVGALARAHDGDLNNAVPEAQFPARLAIVRIQAPGYRSFDVQSVGSGSFSVVYVHEVEKDSDLDGIHEWPQVNGVSQGTSLEFPATFHSLADLREAAANAQADVLFVYTFDTVFHIENRALQPQQVLGLGVLPGREAGVTSTAAGLFIDVRSGFIYGSAQSTSIQRTLMTKWTKPSDADDTRLKAETSAFSGMLGEARKSWDRIVARYAPPDRPPPPPHSTMLLVNPPPIRPAAVPAQTPPGPGAPVAPPAQEPAAASPGPEPAAAGSPRDSAAPATEAVPAAVPPPASSAGPVP